MQPTNVYREIDIKTAGPIRIVIMLYDEALKQLDIVQEAFSKEDKKFDRINNAIGKAQDIITELLVSLDLEKGGEIAQNLSRLYFYFNRVLGEANIKKENSSELQTIRNLIADLRDAWVQISNTPFSGKDLQDSKIVDISG